MLNQKTYKHEKATKFKQNYLHCEGGGKSSTKLNCKAIMAGAIFAISNVGWGQITISTNTIWDASNAPTSGYQAGIIIDPEASLSVSSITLNMNNSANIILTNGVFNSSTSQNDQAKLTFTNATVNFGTNGKLEVGKWGELTVITSTLKTNNANIKWAGIDALQEGTDQFSTPNSINTNGTCTPAEWSGTLSPLATKVILQRATISFADIGMHALGDDRRPRCSAVVKVTGSFFNNCKEGIRMTANFSKNFSPRGASYIMNTNFIWDHASMASIANKMHVLLL